MRITFAIHNEYKMGKTKNHSIRFDEDKLDFFKRENPGIDKPQQVVDFFLDEFWWKHNGKWISPKEISEVPTLVRQKQSDKRELVHKSDAPDPSDKGAYLKWLKNQ